MLTSLLKSSAVKIVFQQSLLYKVFLTRIQVRQLSNSHGSSSFKLLKAEPQCFHAGLYQINSFRQFHKLLVGHLPAEATEKVLEEHFSEYGMVLSVKIVRNAQTLKSESHAYVFFSDDEALGNALKFKPHFVCNKQVSVRIFQRISFVIQGLSPSTTQESMHNYFSQFGRVMTCHSKIDSKKNLDYGFVNFHELNQTDEEFIRHQHEIDGKKVKVLRQLPRELTLRVGNLSLSTTEEMVRDFYSQFGSLVGVELMRDRWTGISRGFARVCFSTQQELDLATSSQPHVIDEKIVELDYETHEFTIFVAELPPNTSEEDLTQYFKKFGPVYKCNIARDKQTNQLLYHGWVTFSTREAVTNVTDETSHVLNGKKIFVNSSKGQGGVASTLVVEGFPATTTNEMLYDVFSKFGSHVRCFVKPGKELGFVTFPSKKSGNRSNAWRSTCARWKSAHC